MSSCSKQDVAPKATPPEAPPAAAPAPKNPTPWLLDLLVERGEYRLPGLEHQRNAKIMEAPFPFILHLQLKQATALTPPTGLRITTENLARDGEYFVHSYPPLRSEKRLWTSPGLLYRTSFLDRKSGTDAYLALYELMKRLGGEEHMGSIAEAALQMVPREYWPSACRERGCESIHTFAFKYNVSQVWIQHVMRQDGSSEISVMQFGEVASQ
jgi:hypothetical protein